MSKISTFNKNHATAFDNIFELDQASMYYVLLYLSHKFAALRPDVLGIKAGISRVKRR
jgi:hypothetical protein